MERYYMHQIGEVPSFGKKEVSRPDFLGGARKIMRGTLRKAGSFFGDSSRAVTRAGKSFFLGERALMQGEAVRASENMRSSRDDAEKKLFTLKNGVKLWQIAVPAAFMAVGAGVYLFGFPIQFLGPVTAWHEALFFGALPLLTLYGGRLTGVALALEGRDWKTLFLGPVVAKIFGQRNIDVMHFIITGEARFVQPKQPQQGEQPQQGATSTIR